MGASSGRLPLTSRLKAFFAELGPGLVTGAADDDPSGIATYSLAGAAFGFGLLWTALLSFPLMAAVQLMCARLGMVTGRGLASVLARRYSRSALWGACTLLVIANTFNISADLAAMAEVTAMVTGVGTRVCLVFFTALILLALCVGTYRQIALVFKWLTLVLFAYVACAFLVRPPWGKVLAATFAPTLDLSNASLSMMVAILGTTISPYLFFWQTSVEVEEEIAAGRRTVRQRRGATRAELGSSRRDVLTGMFASNFIMYFVILSAGATLHAHGQTQVTTAKEAAEALRPFAGDWAYLLFASGIVGTGMLGIPVLAGSSSYAISGAAGWGGSLEKRPHQAKAFYAVLSTSMLVGSVIAFVGGSAVSMLFWAAVLNGILAPPLIFLVVRLTSDPQVMGGRVNPPLLSFLGWTAAVGMSVAAIAMLASWR